MNESDLSSNAVLLHEGFLGEVELKGVIGRDGDVQAPGNSLHSIYIVYRIKYKYMYSLNDLLQVSERYTASNISIYLVYRTQ